MEYPPPLSINSVEDDYTIPHTRFLKIEERLKEFLNPEFTALSMRGRFQRVNELLVALIQETTPPAFLLPAVVDFIERVNDLRVLRERYHIALFEFWLNQFSQLTEAENYQLRAKIAGKWIPREEYQSLFPIGMGKIYGGTHFVAAHLSPDVDTMVASFWGWVDAFAARVGDSRHIWSLPGGPPDSPVTHIFKKLFGISVFYSLSSSTPSLSLAAIDLLSQKGVAKKKGGASLSSLDQSTAEKALILVNSEGHYLGDWHNVDVEPIRKIIIRFKSCLRWFENNLHVQLISFFAKKQLSTHDIPDFLSRVFDVAISSCEPVREFTEKQKNDLNDFFKNVIGLKEGLDGTFRQLNEALTTLSVYELSRFQKELEELYHSPLFDKSGMLIEDRPAIFTRFESIIKQLDMAIHRVRDYVEQLDVAIHIKHEVLRTPAQYVTLRSDIEDIRIKMQKREYVTVVITDGDDHLYPLGVVWASMLTKPSLGTVSFRDFSNQEEIRMSSYLTPVSVIDHHKGTLATTTPPIALIGDAQSCNVLVAEQAFLINDRYGLGGISPQTIEGEIAALQGKKRTQSSGRLMQRLLQRSSVLEQKSLHSFIHPHRELAEYICFLHAILDDTDLLTKVSKRDVDCVASLLNRMKSLTLGKEVEVIDFDEIPQDSGFVKKAAKKILQHPEMYAIYRKVYESKEQEVEKHLTQCQQEHYAYLFADTKEQNGCCRVGQTKLFSSNYPTFQKNAVQIMKQWLEKAEAAYQDRAEIDLYLHMISTIPSAEEVYQGEISSYCHRDQLWFWVPNTQKGHDHLSSFLTAFLASQSLGKNKELEFLPDVSPEVRAIFLRHFFDVSSKLSDKAETGLPIVILHFDAGKLNSRKAQISPYLPRVI